MKKGIPYVFLIVLFGLCVGCSNKKEDDHTSHTDEESILEEWKEMDSFHMVMAESFHPYMDSGNVAPAKANAAVMEELASKWKSSSLPEKMNNETVKRKLNALQKSTFNFQTVVLQADDKVVGDSLTRLHDLFHSIMEDWYGKHEHHHAP